MSAKTVQTRLKVMRNTEEYFNGIKDTFIPLKGEIVLVDTASNGLRAKVGDGTKSYSTLAFSDQNLRDQISGIVVRGYYYNGVFYADNNHTITIIGYEYKIYIDIPTNSAYIYFEDTHQYAKLFEVPVATSSTAGVVKIYETTGQNTDGTMTQSAITTEINKKFEVSTNLEDESISFYNR